MGSIFALAAAAVDVLPVLIKAGVDVASLYTATKQVIAENRAPGDAEWDALDAKVEALRAELHRDPS